MWNYDYPPRGDSSVLLCVTKSKWKFFENTMLCAAHITGHIMTKNIYFCISIVHTISHSTEKGSECPNVFHIDTSTPLLRRCSYDETVDIVVFKIENEQMNHIVIFILNDFGCMNVSMRVERNEQNEDATTKSWSSFRLFVTLGRWATKNRSSTVYCISNTLLSYVLFHHIQLNVSGYGYTAYSLLQRTRTQDIRSQNIIIEDHNFGEWNLYVSNADAACSYCKWNRLIYCNINVFLVYLSSVFALIRSPRQTQFVFINMFICADKFDHDGGHPRIRIAYTRMEVGGRGRQHID